MATPCEPKSSDLPARLRFRDVAAELSSAFDRPVTVQLGWIPVQTPQQGAEDDPASSAQRTGPGGRKVVGRTISEHAGLSLESGTLVVATAGPRPPQSSAKLAAEIKEKFDQQIPISVGGPVPRDNGPTDDETALAAARTNAANWAASRPGVAVLEVAGSAEAVSVTLIGDEKPDVSELEAELRTTLPRQSSQFSGCRAVCWSTRSRRPAVAYNQRGGDVQLITGSRVPHRSRALGRRPARPRLRS